MMTRALGWRRRRRSANILQTRRKDSKIILIKYFMNGVEIHPKFYHAPVIAVIRGESSTTTAAAALLRFCCFSPLPPAAADLSDQGVLVFVVLPLITPRHSNEGNEDAITSSPCPSSLAIFKRGSCKFVTALTGSATSYCFVARLSKCVSTPAVTTCAKNTLATLALARAPPPGACKTPTPRASS